MHKIIQMAIGITVAAIMLLIVMVPVLDSLTITKIDATEDEDAIYYKAANPDISYVINTTMWTTEGVTYSANSVSNMNTGEQIYDFGWLQETPDGKLLAFGDDSFALCLQTKSTSSTSPPSLSYLIYGIQNSESNTIYSKYVDYGVNRIIMRYENDHWDITLGEYPVYPNVTTETLYLPTLDKNGEYISCKHATINYEKSCTVYQFGEGSGSNTPIATKYNLSYTDESGEIVGTSTKENRGLNESCIVYTPYNGNGSTITAPYTIDKTDDRYTVTLGPLSGSVVSQTTTYTIHGYDDSYAILVESDQDIVSEYRDLIMLAPVLMAVALLAGMVVTLYNGTRS